MSYDIQQVDLEQSGKFHTEHVSLFLPLVKFGMCLFFQGIQQGIIEGEFAICISLYHGYELLQQMGMRSLYFFLCGIMDGTKGKLYEII